MSIDEQSHHDDDEDRERQPDATADESNASKKGVDNDGGSSHDTFKDPGAPDNEDELIEVVVLRQDELEAPTAKFVFADSMAAATWSEQYAAVEHLRQTIKFHSEHIQTSFPDLEKCLTGLVVPSAMHLRSALARSGVFCIGEFVQCLQEASTAHLDILVPVLLHRSVNEKKFIRDAANEALTHTAASSPPLALLHVLMPTSTDKNPQLVATAGEFIERATARCRPSAASNQDDVHAAWEEHLDAWMPHLARFLACRVVACKAATKRTILLLRAMLGLSAMTRAAKTHLTGSALVDMNKLLATPAAKPSAKPSSAARPLSLRERMMQQQKKQKQQPNDDDA
ncbi:Aste57867_1291 [Aphanomyces stellatus]|uniref:Aste57867_1291 protein n=1 Tax=Aphanomyces stellatus TaxID=120398 RepID=A0A485K7I6_9STRA|nr:hypothetical protein As57867_001290 [Aphanomyces stellatus]VFT78510.1 Aste57867_1291 [Aphanomyces stellatus]